MRHYLTCRKTQENIALFFVLCHDLVTKMKHSWEKERKKKIDHEGYGESGIGR